MRYIRLLLLIIAVVCLFSLTALAAPGDHDLIKVGEAYTLVYETDAQAGTQVVLIMMAGSTLEDGKVPLNVAGDISYIDQTAVVSDGGMKKVTFSGFIPKDTDEDYHSIYLGGLGEGPTYVTTISASGVMVSGTVEYFGSDTLTVNLYDNSKTNVVKTTTVSKVSDGKIGDFVFPDVEIGLYHLKVNRDYCVSEYKPIVVSAGDMSVENIAYRIFAGDVNSSGEINIFDISALLDDFGKSSGLIHQGSDVNLSGEVNIFDISALLDGFGKKNE